MDKDDKWVYIIVGALIGLPLGMALYKYLIGDKPTAQASQQNGVYGFNYAYDAQGHLTSFVPVPLGSNSVNVVTEQAAPAASSSSSDTGEGLLLP
jgi:hypothetical protein